MKKLITVCQVLVIAAVISSLAFAEQIIQSTEPMVGAHHATLPDTLNRGFLIQHNAEGVHTTVPYSVLTGVPTTFPWDNLTGTPTTLSGYGITDALSAITDSSITPPKLQATVPPDNTLFYRGDGEWGDPGIDFQAQLDAKQNFDADLAVLSYATPNRIFYSNGSRAITELPFGDNGTCLKFTGATSAPTTGACGSGVGSLDNTTMDNTTIGVTVPAEAHVTTFDATGNVDMLSTASTGGVHTFQGGSVHVDNQDASFGTSSNWKCRYAPTTLQFICTTAAGAAFSDALPMFVIDVGTGTTLGAGQTAFGIADNGSLLWSVTKSGNTYQSGTAYVGEIQTNCSYADNTCLYNAANVGRPSDNTPGNEAYDNTAKEKVVSVDGVWRYGQYDALEFVVGNGTDAITTGQKGHIEVPYPCDIQSIRLFADASGSIVVNLWKDSYANFPPTVADNVTGTGTKPTLSSATHSEQTDFTNYTTTTLAAGDVIAYNVDLANTVKRVTISIRVRK